MNHISLHPWLAAVLVALVAGCAADHDPDTAAASEDVSASQLRFSSSTLAARDLVLSPASNGALYATYLADEGLVVARSDDQGVHWSTLSTIPGEKAPARVVVAPSNPKAMYVVRRGFYSWGYGPPPAGADPALFPRGLFLRSDDGGRTWSDRTTGLSEEREGGDGFDTLDINPTDDQHLVAASCSGVQKSLDGGKTWRVLPNTDHARGFCNGGNLYRGVDDRATIYVLYSIGEGGASLLMRTYDDGVTWEDAKLNAAGADYGYLVGADGIVVHPNDARHIYLTDMRSFYSSANGGEDFFRHGRGLGESPSSVAVDAADGALYVSSQDSVYRWMPAEGEPENGHWNRIARIDGATLGAPVVADHRLYVTTGSQLLIAPL